MFNRSAQDRPLRRKPCRVIHSYIVYYFRLILLRAQLEIRLHLLLALKTEIEFLLLYLLGEMVLLLSAHFVNGCTYYSPCKRYALLLYL